MRPLSRSGAVLPAALLLLALLRGVPVTAQQGPDEATLARADSVRASLERPPGDHGLEVRDVLRVPFQMVGALTATVAGVGYGAWLLADRWGAVEAWESLEREGIHIGLFRPGHRGMLGPEVRFVVADPLFFEAGVTLRGYQRYAAGLSFSGRRWEAEAAGAYTRLLQPHFWGVGPDTPAEARSDYRRDVLEAGVEAAWRPRPRWALGASAAWERNEVRRGHDGSRPDLHDVFDPADLTGAADRLSFARLGLAAEWEGLRTGRGGRAEGVWAGVGYRIFLGVAGTDPDFHTVGAELGGSLPLSEHQSVTLSALVEVADPFDGGEVPFYHLPAAGGDDVLRGHRSGRFRDRALVALRGEYGWRVYWSPSLPEWRGDAFLFADAATLGPALGDVSAGPVHLTPGLGVRIHREGSPLAELFVAFGGDALRIGGDLDVAF